MIFIPNLEIKTIEDFLENHFNQQFYNFYHQSILSKYDFKIDLLELFKSIYQDVSVLYYNYYALPFETRKYFLDRHNHISNPLEFLIRDSLFFYFFTLLNDHVSFDEQGNSSVKLNDDILINSFWRASYDDGNLNKEAAAQIGILDEEKQESEIEVLINGIYAALEKNKSSDASDHINYRKFFKRLTNTSILNNPISLDKKLSVKNDSSRDKSLKWSGTALELSELLKALTASKCFIGHTDKEVFEKMFCFLNVEYSESIKRDRLRNVKNRVLDLTPFLDKLHINLESWIKSKDR